MITLKKEIICGIYIIRNLINNKVYVGQSKDILERWRKHRSDLTARKKHNDHFQLAWDKYTESNFNFEILEICGEDYLDEREKYWIKHYQSNNKNFGYNKTSGGQLYRKISEETKEKIKKVNQGKKLPSNHPFLLLDRTGKNNPMYNVHRYGEDSPMYGKSHSNETKQIISEKNKGNIPWNRGVKNFLGEDHPMKGKELTEEVKCKISQANKGKKRSEDTINKLIASAKRGEENYLSVLTENQVIEIKILLRYTKMLQKEIANLYNINQRTVSAIKNEKIWKHVNIRDLDDSTINNIIVKYGMSVK